MKLNKDDIPVKMQSPGTTLRSQQGFGSMTVAYNDLPKGTDITPLLHGLANDSCHCPHWGYILAGGLLVKYDDGKEDYLQTGDTFYLPPGHTGIVQEDLQFIEFSPTKEFAEVMEHIGKKMAEFEGAK